MELDITCGDCQKFYRKSRPLPENEQPYRRGRKREEKVGWCKHYDLPTNINQFYGQCDHAKRVEFEIKKPVLSSASPSKETKQQLYIEIWKPANAAHVVTLDSLKAGEPHNETPLREI